MSSRNLIRSVVIAIGGWLAGLSGSLAADAGVMSTGETHWDVSQPRGRSREITFTTDEGTWMSLDMSPDQRWIVFDLLGQIFRIPANGGAATLLANVDGTTANYHPRYSPDGKTIVFVSDRGGQDNLWLMDADGGHQRPLLLDLESRFVEPAWMPDGRTVVVTRRLQRPGFGFIVTTDTLWTVSVPDGRAQELVGLGGKPDVPRPGWGHFRSDNIWNGADRHQWPAASPDGRYVYFETSWYGGNPRHLQRIELATRYIQDVTETKDRYSDDCCAERPLPNYLTEVAPELSPDGNWLAFARRIPEGRLAHSGHEVTGRTALWLRDLRTGRERVLMDPITRDAVNNLPNYQERVLPGYAWARDSASLIIPVGGNIRRVWLSDGHVDTIPFQAEIRRRVSEMARSQVRIPDTEFTPRYTRWLQHSPAGSQSVFEAAGTLWVRDDDNSAPRALQTPVEGQVQLTPAWSMKGDAIAFTAAIDGSAGTLTVVDVGSGQAKELLSGSTPYLRPSFSRDGKWVYFDRWPTALTRTRDTNEWELVRVPREGGEPELVAELHAATWGDAWYGDVRFFLDQGENGTVLKRLDLATKKITDVVSVAPGAATVSESPDEKWLAIEQAEDVYVVSASAAHNGAPLDIFDKKTTPSVRRITKTGGRYPHWRADSILELASASDIVTYDPASGKSTVRPAGLVLPRSIGHGTIVFSNARLLTMGPKGVIGSGDVVVGDSRILCVGHCEIPADAKQIDATGKTIMPGLFDVHAHAFIDDENDEVFSMRRAESAAYLAYGVTTIHDPFGAVVPTFSISDAIEAGRMVGPRTYSAGGALTCLNGTVTLRPIHSVEDALEHIDRKRKLGVISVKDYLICNRIQRQMLTEAARMRGMTITNELGPLYYLVGQAVNGDTGWEHMIQTIVYKDVTEFFGRVGSTNDPTLMLSDFSNGLALERWYGQTNLLTDPKAQLWTPWQRAVARRLFIRKPDSEYIFPWIAQGDAAIKAAGGHVAVGGHGEANGIGTHWEIWTQRTGMSAQQSLEAATIDSARFIGLEKELGSVETGKIADLIVLEADPTEDIHNTVKLDLVMKAGKLYDARTLDELWPDRKSFGTPPWLDRQILQTNVKDQ